QFLGGPRLRRTPARRQGPRRGRGRTERAPRRQLRHLLRRAQGLGDDPVQRQGGALGGRRAVAFAAAGPAAGGRPLRTEGAVLGAARAADGRAALRRRRRDRGAEVAARAGARAPAAGAGQLPGLMGGVPVSGASRDEPVALALGAGGARGLAQIGVIEALQARGMRVVAVAGASSGARVGGAFAAGKLDARRDWMQGTSRGAMLRLLDPGFGRPALFTGDRLVRALREVVGEPRIEDLPVDFTAVAVDLVRQREVWLRRGDLWDALRASFAIPGVFTPSSVDGRELVDGGLLAPLPITATRLSGAHRLVAVDMHGWPQSPPGEVAREGDQADDAPGMIGRWVERHFGGAADGDGRPDHRFGLTETMSRALDTMQAQIARVQMALDPPELLIRIPRDACQFYEF